MKSAIQTEQKGCCIVYRLLQSSYKHQQCLILIDIPNFVWTVDEEARDVSTTGKHLGGQESLYSL